MKQVIFYDSCPEEKLKYAVIVARFQDKWIFCRHKERTTWEIPGGHLEPAESAGEAASRELWEETGALRAEIETVSVYGFHDLGMLYYANVLELGPIPESSEIKEIAFFDNLPEELTYPHIQPALFERVKRWLGE